MRWVMMVQLEAWSASDDAEGHLVIGKGASHTLSEGKGLQVKQGQSYF